MTLRSHTACPIAVAIDARFDAGNLVVIDPRVVVLGCTGLDRDLTVSILTAGRVRMGDDLVSADVIVLVDPEREHWLKVAAGTAYPSRPIIVVRPQGYEGCDLLDAARRGAVAFIDGDAAPSALVDAVHIVAAGKALLSPAAARRLLDALRSTYTNDISSYLELTPREREILESIEQGHSVKQTARSIGVATKTIENLQGRLFRKLGVRNRVEALVRSHELGLLGVDADPCHP